VAAHPASASDSGANGLLTLAAPAWLLGVLLLPVIRWLHRGGRQARAVPVSRLGLWRRTAASSPAVGERRPPDPAWRRRALLTALLFVALAEPRMPQQRTEITVWVDDSVSMLTREEHGTRLDEGLAQVRALLDEIPRADVQVRTLGDPWQRLGAPTESTVATLAAGVGRKEPAAPPGALLRRDSLHWLVTDGAHAALFEWPGGSRPDRIIQVGSVTRNVGLERLSARRNLNDPDQYDVLLKVANGGNAAETRVVVLATEAGEIARSTLRLEPGGSTLFTATTPASANVRASLQPGDALAEDDQIVLDLRPLHRHRVATDAKCPAALRAAIAAHPALALANENATDVAARWTAGHVAPRATLRRSACLRIARRRHCMERWSGRPPCRSRAASGSTPGGCRLRRGSKRGRGMRYCSRWAASRSSSVVRAQRNFLRQHWTSARRRTCAVRRFHCW